MKRTVDIDTLLADDCLELTLGGKVYTVQDVKMSTFLRASKLDLSSNDDTLCEQLALILGVPRSELDNIGIRAISMALKEVRLWMSGIFGDEETEEGKSERAENP